MKNFIVLTIGIVVFFSSCNPVATSKTDLEKLEWLLGSWIDITEERELHEVWIKINDTSFYGESYLLANGDTAFYETMTLIKHQQGIILTPTTMNQNNGNPIPFFLISSETGIYIFENKEHDFPQRIVYTNPEPDSLHAYIEGEENGKYRRSDFQFKKDK